MICWEKAGEVVLEILHVKGVDVSEGHSRNKHAYG